MGQRYSGKVALHRTHLKKNDAMSNYYFVAAQMTGEVFRKLIKQNLNFESEYSINFTRNYFLRVKKLLKLILSSTQRGEITIVITHTILDKSILKSECPLLKTAASKYCSVKNSYIVT